MKEISELLKALKAADSTANEIVLLEKLGNDCGFFAFHGCLCFCSEHTSHKTFSDKTRYLEFQPKLMVTQISNDASFPSGFYDFLILSKDASLSLLEAFVKFSRLYVNDRRVSLDKFVDSFMELFSETTNEQKTNVIGLFGELSFLREALNRNIDLLNYWHVSGPLSSLDFVSRDFSADIKTTLSDIPRIEIRHDQLFDGKNHGVVVVLLKNDDSGESLNDLIHFFETNEAAANNFVFQLALSKERMKPFNEESLNGKFAVRKYLGYETDFLQKIEKIPPCVTNLSYRYEFDEDKSVDPFSLLTERLQLAKC